MVRIPPEIIKIIIDELNKFKEPKSRQKVEEATLKGIYDTNQPIAGLARYAVVSKVWQSLVETHVFKSLYITSQELAYFGAIVKKRKKFVRHLHYLTVLPEYDFKKLLLPESSDEKQKNSEVFSEAVKELFEKLSSWSLVASKHNDFQLCLSSHSPTDARVRTATYEERGWYGASTAFKRRCNPSFFQFLDDHGEAARDVEIVTSLSYSDQSQRPLDPASLCVIASHLPNLRRLDVDFLDWGTTEHRKQIRGALATATAALPTSLQICNIGCQGEAPDDERGPAPCLVLPGKLDDLSSGAHLLSQRLTSFSLGTSVLGFDLFWPNQQDNQQNDQHGSQPFWPSLRDFRIAFLPMMADGQWLFEKDPTYAEYVDEVVTNDEGKRVYHIRSKPIIPLFDRLHTNIALAAARMPKLEKLSVTLTDYHILHIQHEFYFEDNGKERSTKWDVCTGYQPSDKVIEAWKMAKGNDIKITIIQTKYDWQTWQDANHGWRDRE